MAGRGGADSPARTMLALPPEISRVTAAGQGDEIQVYQIERGYGNPCYAGTLELRTTAEGIVMINELPLEDYLCKVVPGEMPASYEMEALEADGEFVPEVMHTVRRLLMVIRSMRPI